MPRSAGALARELGVGFVPARKAGKLPPRPSALQYGLEYGLDELHLHADALSGGTRVLVHDDVLATGGTAKAKTDLVDRLGGQVVGCAFVAELAFLGGRRDAVRLRRPRAGALRVGRRAVLGLVLEPVDHSGRFRAGQGGEVRQRRREHGGEHLAARGGDQPQQLVDGRGVRRHAVGVIGRIAEQAVGQLGPRRAGRVSGPAVWLTAVTPATASERISERVLKRGPSTWP